MTGSSYKLPKLTCVYQWCDVTQPDHVLYVGSTVHFWKRFTTHCRNFEFASFPFHKAMRDRYKGDFSKLDMFVLEEHTTISKNDLKDREAYWQSKLKPEFGRPEYSGDRTGGNVACCQRYYHRNKQTRYEKNKIYNAENRAKINEYYRNYRALKKLQAANK